MMKFLLYPVILILIIIACKKPEEKHYRLTDDQLVNLMFDMHLADVILPQFPRHQQDSIKDIYLKRMTEMYDLSAQQIEEEMNILQSDPEKMKFVLGRVKIMADSLQ